MFRFAILFLIVSLVAGTLGLSGISIAAKRIAMVLFALFFIGFLALIGLAWIIGEAIEQTLLLPWRDASGGSRMRRSDRPRWRARPQAAPAQTGV